MSNVVARPVIVLDHHVTDDEWDALLEAAHEHVLAHGEVVVDASGLTLVPRQVAAVARLVHALPPGTVRVSCSRLSGRRVLRRLLPPGVDIILPGHR